MDNKRTENKSLKKQSTFKNDVLKLISSTTIVQMISVLAAPVVTRLYAPDAFGLAALYSSILGILSVFGSMRYDVAIVLPESDKDAVNLVGVSIVAAFSFSSSLLLLVTFEYDAISKMLNAPLLKPYLFILIISVFLGSITSIVNAWVTRMRQFGWLSTNRVISSATSTGFQLGAGFSGFTSGGSLIFSGIAASLVSIPALVWKIWKTYSSLFISEIRWKVMKEMVIKYKELPLLNIWSVLMNTISWQLPIILISKFFSTEETGFYALGMRVLTVPMEIVATSISQVFYQRAAEAKTEGILGPLVESTIRRLFLFGAFPMLMFIFVGQDLFYIVFGARWLEAGLYCQILVPFLFVWFVSSPISSLINVQNRQLFGLKVNGAILLTRLFSFGIGGFYNNIYLALGLFTFTGILCYGFMTQSLIREAGVKLTLFFPMVISRLVMTVLAGGIIIGLRTLGMSSIVIVIVAFSIVIVYLGISILNDRSLFVKIPFSIDKIFTFIKQKFK